ncbi:hypothetical protein ABZ477_07665 [Microbacterium sp. NPDC019599]|uniref:hypothetical protein n=1 Tax=Microbacterium sp. NPDC019599 TaxID=3154690 RepID=UPI0033E53CD2
MDDATRAELAELRRRAFGLEPDIADDPAAIDRLVQLEGLVLAEHAASAPLHPEPAVAVDPVPADGALAGVGVRQSVTAPPRPVVPQPVAAGADPVEQAPVRQRRAPRRDGWGYALVAALVATVVVLLSPVEPPPPSSAEVTIETTRSAYTFARDSDAEVLVRVPIDGWYGVDNSELTPEDIPPFRPSGPIEWASHLGEYYGWDLWIAGAEGALQDEQCILVIRGAVAKSRCTPAYLRPYTALVVSLPYRFIEPHERPPGLVPGRRIGFWWAEDDSVTILMGATPEGG